MRKTEAVKPGEPPKHIEMTPQEVEKRQLEVKKAEEEQVEIEKQQQLRELFYDRPEVMYCLAVIQTSRDLIEKDKAIEYIKKWIDTIKKTDPNLEPMNYDKNAE